MSRFFRALGTVLATGTVLRLPFGKRLSKLNVMSQPLPISDWQPPTVTMTAAQKAAARLPAVPLKMRPQYGVFLRRPADPAMWAHPDDHATIVQFVPGARVFKRDICADYSDRELGFVAYHYGAVKFRARPILWRRVDFEGYQPGDRVEIKSQGRKTRPRVATVTEAFWHQPKRRIEYAVTTRGMQLARRFVREEFRPSIPLGKHMPTQHLAMARDERLA
jgi:hypothetical protein